MKTVHTLVLLAALASCKSASVPTAGDVEAGAAVATGVCSLLEGIDDSGTLRSICATALELAEVAAFILTLRTADAGTTSDAGRPDYTACAFIPGSAVCATSAERAKAILFLSQARASRFATDAGVP